MPVGVAKGNVRILIHISNHFDRNEITVPTTVTVHPKILCGIHCGNTKQIMLSVKMGFYVKQCI